jgi:two-component system response regulator AtoC
VTLLANCFVRRYAERDGAATRTLPAELIEAFMAYQWPGNVRELENAVRRYLILPDLETALADLRRPGHSPAPAPPRELSLKKLAADAADHAERETVRRVLDETKWNRRQAARRLNISYKALLNKLKKWEAVPADPPKGG